jgi:ABC-2 type transport system permease protein
VSVSVHGVRTVASVECTKLAAQWKARAVLAVCLAGPFLFAAVIRLQSVVPADTLFGRSVKESGFAASLVVLGFAALWAFPVLTSIVGGDIFSAEDRHGTWKTVLTRSRGRSEIFAGKVLAALSFSVLAVLALAVSSIAAGVLVIGFGPLIDLSGRLLAPAQALTSVALAWTTVLVPALGFTGFAMLLSVVTRSSAAGIGLPVLAGLTMQLYALVDGPEALRRLLITSSFGAWHGLLTDPPFYGPILHGTLVSAIYFVVCLAIAYRLLQRRDIGG